MTLGREIFIIHKIFSLNLKLRVFQYSHLGSEIGTGIDFTYQECMGPAGFEGFC